MSVTSHQLCNASTKRKDVDYIIKTQLDIIDELLLNSDKCWGDHNIVYTLPNTFVLTGLNRKSIERIVYSTIILSLQKRGFKIVLDLLPDQSVIHIMWTTEISQIEIDAQNKILKDVIIKK